MPIFITANFTANNTTTNIATTTKASATRSTIATTAKWQITTIEIKIETNGD